MKGLLLILMFSCTMFGQKSVADLKPSHAAELKKFLSKHKKYKFLSEKAIGADYLKNMRKNFGATFKPYYKVADFNQDKILDFSLILSRTGKPRKDPDVTSEEHKYKFPLAVVIFNGIKKGGFRQAFVEDLEEPHVCFFHLTNEKKKRLTFGIYETDTGFILTPVGKGYRVEYHDQF